MPPDSGIGFSLHIMQLTLDDNLISSFIKVIISCIYGALATAHLQRYAPMMQPPILESYMTGDM